MTDILLAVPINAPPTVVFDAMTLPVGLDRWWTLNATGNVSLGATYALGFGMSSPWRAVVTRCEKPVAFEWTLHESDSDWTDTRVGFELTATASGTQVEFYHRGWREENAHYRGSTYCWATYLRILKRALEHGEVVPYQRRDDA